MYENNQWKSTSSLSLQSSSQPLNQENFTAGTAMNASFMIFNPAYQIAPYNSDELKFFFEIPNTLEFDAQRVQIPNYTLEMKSTIKGGIKAKFWIGEEHTFELSYDVIKVKLLEGNWDILPQKIEVAAASNNQIGEAGKKLSKPLQVIIRDIDGAVLKGAKVEWKVKSGGGSLTAAESVTDVNGVAQIEWTLGTTGEQSVEASAKKKYFDPFLFIKEFKVKDEKGKVQVVPVDVVKKSLIKDQSV